MAYPTVEWAVLVTKLLPERSTDKGTFYKFEDANGREIVTRNKEDFDTIAGQLGRTVKVEIGIQPARDQWPEAYWLNKILVVPGPAQAPAEAPAQQGEQPDWELKQARENYRILVNAHIAVAPSFEAIKTPQEAAAWAFMEAEKHIHHMYGNPDGLPRVVKGGMFKPDDDEVPFK